MSQLSDQISLQQKIVWTSSCTHQDVLALSKAHGNLCSLTAYIHQLRVDHRHALSQEQDGIFVLLPPHPKT